MVLKTQSIPQEKIVKEKIPDYLVYETLDGVPVYYRGYRNVLNKKQNFEEIMAYGSLQVYLLNFLKDYFQPIFGKDFWVWTGEAGLHISHGSNPSLDFVMLPKSAFSLKQAKNKYLDTPPTVVIEVDTKADLIAFEAQNDENYYVKKTKTLLDFGVQQVVWIFTNDDKITIARPNEPLLTVNWSDEIEIMGHRFSLQQIIDNSESESTD